MELEKEVKNPPNSAEESAADLAEETNMTSSLTDANAGSSSDNESWTILDEDDQENDTLVTLNTRIDVIKSTAQFTKREINTPGKDYSTKIKLDNTICMYLRSYKL